MSGGHAPVLLDEAIATLAPVAGGTYLDGTFGGGGYSRAILDRAPCRLFAIDRDPAAIERGAALARSHSGRLVLIEGCFGDMVAMLDAHGVDALDGVVLDLGVSSFQLDEPARGFSFRADGPLDMRMGRNGPTAATLVNTLPEADLADLLHVLGEERHARRIAHAIVARRDQTPFATTAALAAAIRAVVPRSRDGIDPATRAFQALRMRVNDELGEVERGLAAAAALLAPGGRLVVVSFHSGEDRLVKHFMAARAGRTPNPSRHLPAAGVDRAPEFALLGRRAGRPDRDETERNRRARSGRLRALERLPRPHAVRGECA